MLSVRCVHSASGIGVHWTAAALLCTTAAAVLLQSYRTKHSNYLLSSALHYSEPLRRAANSTECCALCARSLLLSGSSSRGVKLAVELPSLIEW
jgi:hypothetical protein